jgi:ABC-type nitrate/sulfonate/bicarbonate transport system substrate-binding protein
MTFMLKQILTKHGLDGNKDVVYLDVGREISPALLGGGMDAAVLSVESSVTSGWIRNERDVLFGNEVKNSWGTLATTDKLIKENPKLVGGFVRAASSRYVTCARIGKKPFRHC